MNKQLQQDLETLIAADPGGLEIALWLIRQFPSVPVYAIVIAVGILAISFWICRIVVSKAVETQTDLIVKAAFEDKNWDKQFARLIEQAMGEEFGKLDVHNANWTNKLDQILEQNRGIERQKLRAASYGELWANTKDLALYSDKPVDRSSALQLSDVLTEWYFSPTGGMMLTKHVRELYFALQDLLRATGQNEEEWQALRITEDLLPHLRDVLCRKAPDIKSKGGPVFEGVVLDDDYFDDLISRTVNNPPQPSSDDWSLVSLKASKNWRSVVSTLGDREIWQDLSETDRFVVIQQASSILRTALTRDIEARQL